MRKELLKGLTDEQIAKVKSCKSNEEVLALAKEEGVELTGEQLEAVSGGGCYSAEIFPCPQCKSKKYVKIIAEGGYWTQFQCSQCDITWTKT